MVNNKMLFCFCLIISLLSCKTIGNLYDLKIDKTYTSQTDLSKIGFEGYYYFRWKYFNEELILALVFLQDGTVIRTWKTDFIDFYSFENYLISEEFENILKNSNVLIGNYTIDEDKLVAQFEIFYGMTNDFIQTDVYSFDSSEYILIHNKSYGEEIKNSKDVYHYKEFGEIDVLKQKVDSILSK